jgi:hypothetical protein
LVLRDSGAGGLQIYNISSYAATGEAAMAFAKSWRRE